MTKVWRFLASNSRAWTVQDLAECLAMTPNVVRRQLRQLWDEGLIQARHDGDR